MEFKNIEKDNLQQTNFFRSEISRIIIKSFQLINRFVQFADSETKKPGRNLR
jgi:hypothetical protein